MQEHNDIDELFKDGLENFRPDASHLSYGPVAAGIAAKTTAAGTAVAVKTGFFAKWGMSLYIGLATVAAGTGAAIVYAPDPVAVEANSRTIVVASAQVKEGLQLATALPASDTLSTEQEAFPPVEVHIAVVESGDEINETDRRFDVEKVPFKPTVSDKQRAATNFEKRVKRGVFSGEETKTATSFEALVQPDLTTQSNNPEVGTIQPDDVATSTEELPLKNQEIVDDGLLSAPVDSTMAAIENILTEINGTPSTATDSVAGATNFYAPRPFSWPRHRFSIKAGLGYAPLKTDIVVNQKNEIDSTFFFQFYQNVIDRPSIKNEFAASFSYQKRIKSNLQLGVGLSYLQAGWKSFTDYTEYYYVDNGAGGLYLVVDTVRAGERNITANAASMNLFTGYDFVLGDKWMLGATIGLNLNQVFVKNEFTNYSTNKISTVNRADFIIGAYSTLDLMYRMTDHFALSVGASINGRGTMSRAIGANQFYNNASFGLNGGIHYFFTGSR